MLISALISAATQEHALVSTTDPISQGIVGVVLVVLFALLTLEKAHRVLVALGAVSLLWTITYLTPWHLVTFEGAIHHIDLNVLLLLAGMMALVGVLRSTGAFEWAVGRIMQSAGANPAKVLRLVIWFTGLSSALADNVTTVIFVTPIVLGTARTLGIRPYVFLMPMIMAANVGGTATLVGDPPNIMIGSGAGLTFMDFVRNLTAPVLFMLVLLEWVAIRVFRSALQPPMPGLGRDGDVVTSVPGDPVLLRGLMIISAIVLVGFLTHGITGMPAAVPAVVGAGAALILQDYRYLRNHDATLEEREHGILAVLEHEIEWPTLAFFTFLFIIVGAAVDTGLVERVALLLRDGIAGLRTTWGLSETTTLFVAATLVLWSAGILSALIDNIPFVAVCIPVIHGLLPSLGGENVIMWWSLALGACLGGNGTPVGASANVTAMGLSERGGTVITFKSFMQFGVPVMLVSLLLSNVWIAGFLYLGNQQVMLAALVATVVLWLVLRLIGRARKGAVALGAIGVVAAAGAPATLEAQDRDWTAVDQQNWWFAGFVDRTLQGRWALLGDVQYRRDDDILQPKQLIVRAGLAWRVVPGVRLAAGGGYVALQPYGELPNAAPLHEHQIWTQLMLANRADKLELSHRFRHEQRWVYPMTRDADGDRVKGATQFGHRLRYMVRGAYPLGSLTLGNQPVKAVAYDEAFIGYADVDRGVAFDQNRVFLGLALPVGAQNRVEVGYMRQWIAVPRARASERNHALLIGLFHTK